MSKLSFRARALDASKPMPIYLAEELPDLPDYSAINRAVPQMPSGMEKEEESEHHLQRAISGTGLIIPTPEVCEVTDLQFYERCYPPDYKMPKQHIHMQPLWEEQEAPEYDIDSEDERWLKQQRHPELTELKFEQMMDKLEKCSGQTVVTLSEAKLLLERHDDLVTAVYDYWLNKRLTTQHPLILSVKTENRPGQSSNNPYLAFRRRTEKMQTRKNRKNDESSYEKMLKLRRDLARALTLLELVARRELAKRELVALTGQLAERRYAAGDFANQLLPDPPPRPQYQPVAAPRLPTNYRHYEPPLYPPRAPSTPVDQPRQREKRPYKKRKHRHPAVGSAQGLRDSGVYTSSEEESGSRTEPASPPDDGPFAFRRKPGCFYEMPTSTLYGDPVDPDNTSKDGLFEHEIDVRHRFTLTSIAPGECIGFARRRVGRGGRIILDRVQTPLDDLWPKLPHVDKREEERIRKEMEEVETRAHRTPKEIKRDYHSGGKYPWRSAFRQHLTRNPHLWIDDIDVSVKDDIDINVKPYDVNVKPDDVNVKLDDVKQEPMDVLPDVIPQESVKSDISDSKSTIDRHVSDNLRKVIRKRSWSGCSDSSYDSDESLQPVEKEFERFIDEVNKKWLHFRPKTPPPSPPEPEATSDDQFPIGPDTLISVELRPAEKPPSEDLDTFTTSQFTLGELYGDLNPDADLSGSTLDISGEDLLSENFTGLTEAQVESILSETDLKSLAEDLTKDEKKLSDDIMDLVGDVEGKSPFLLQGQSSDGRVGSGPKRRKAEPFGSTVVQISALDKEPIYIDKIQEPPKTTEAPKEIKQEKVEPVPTSKIIVEEVNEVPHIKLEKKKKDDLIEEVQFAHGVQLKTVQTKHSPLKKHIITSVAHRRPSDVTLVTSQETQQPQIVTVAVSDSLKVRLQNHLLSSQSGVLVQNGPFPSVAVAVPVQQARENAVKLSVGSVSAVSGPSVVSAGGAAVAVAGGGGGAAPPAPRRVAAPLVQLAPAALSHKPLQLHAQPAAHHTTPLVVAQSHTIHHVAPNKLKVLHAHPLSQSARAQLLQTRGVPAVVSLAPLGDARAHAALLKAAPGSVAQFFEIKGGHLAKGPHLVNVLRQPAPRRPADDKRREGVAATVATSTVATTGAKPQRVSVGADGRPLVRAAIPTVPARPRHQIQLNQLNQLKSRPLQVSEARVPGAVVANLLHKTAVLPRTGPKIAISGSPGQPLSANVQAIAFTTAQLKTRQARLIPQPRAVPVAEIVEATTAPVATSSTASISGDTPLPLPTDGEDVRRSADTLPMEVT